MSPQENIKNELNQLGSSLPVPSEKPGYQVPKGYFDTLAETILHRIQLKEELEQLSPVFSSISKEMPYTTPAGYFDSLDLPVTNSNEEHSSLLAELKEKLTYQVPANYFDQLPASMLKQVQVKTEPAKIVPMNQRSRFRYAAAAMITGVALTAGLLFYNTQKNAGPVADINRYIKKVSPEEINSLIELARVDSTTVLLQSTAAEDVKSLIKDISDKEIQDFLNETDLDDSGTNDDLILN